MRNIPPKERPISEQFRIVARQFVEYDNAARLLEECKTATLSEMICNIISESEGMAHNQAEREAKASEQWRHYLDEMVKARTKANEKKVQLEYMRMKFTEWQMGMAMQRDERKMMGSHA